MPTSVGVARTNSDVDGVLSGVKWDVLSLTYSFPTSRASYGFAFYGSYNEPSSGFEALNSTQQAAVLAAYAMIASYTNLSFTLGAGDLRHAMTAVPQVTTAVGYYPSSDASGGDAWYRNGGTYDSPRKGNFAYAAGFLHEIGHTLGLKHPHETSNLTGTVFPVLNPAFDSVEFTVMSYRSYVGAGINGLVNQAWSYPQSYMMLDIAALQAMYGADFGTNGGNTTYSWSPNTGQMFINGVGQTTPGGNKIFLTIWDGGGTDTYNLSNYTNGVKIDLNPGAWTTTSAAQLADLNAFSSSSAQIARGNIANALLYQGDARSLIENGIGGSGNDTLIGNDAANALTGNNGNDSLTGNNGNDTLSGGNGNDYLNGGFGTDTHNGGAGIDTAEYRFYNGPTSVRLDLGQTTFPDFPGVIETLTSIENALTGNGNDLLVGTSAANDLWSFGGTDTLNGGGGNNSLHGGDGDDNLNGGGGNDYLDGGFGTDDINGGSGVDTVDYRFYNGPTNVDLFNGRTSFPGNTTALETLLEIENVLTGNGNDVLIGSNANNDLWSFGGNDVIRGNGGVDKLHGGRGKDLLTGGSAKDFFDFDSIKDSLKGANRDKILDFARGQDDIDLRGIDGKTGVGGNQAFKFIGKQGFHDQKGELRYIDLGSKVIAQGDVNGDGKADFEIFVAVGALSKGDFLL